MTKSLKFKVKEIWRVMDTFHLSSMLYMAMKVFGSLEAMHVHILHQTKNSQVEIHYYIHTVLYWTLTHT